MLLDGALDRIAAARGCMKNGAQAEKSALIHRTVSIISELRGSLNLNEGGELANMWRPTAQPGLWFTAGSLAQCRIYSRYLALQIKAREDGLLPG